MLDAAITPRRHASAAARAVAAVAAFGDDVADLAQQVDRLLHVADEVAAGHLLVLEHVGEVLALHPRVDRGGEARVGAARLGQPRLALGELQVAPHAVEGAARGARPPGSASAAAASASLLSGPRRWNVKHDTTAAIVGGSIPSRRPSRSASATTSSPSLLSRVSSRPASVSVQSST